MPEVTSDHVPAVPEVSTWAQPVLASNPLVKRVTWPPVEVAVKFLPVWLAPLMVTARLVGLKV